MTAMEPFSTMLDMGTGVLDPKGKVVERYLSNMKGMFADPEAEQAIMATEEDRLIYHVYVVELPEEEGQILHCTTVIYPGTVGDEYHMTKGHFHAKRATGEVYFGIAGEGYVILMTDEGEVRHVRMEPGAVVYVPPLWAHRTINTGDTPLTFLSAWPGDAGHDYGTIEERGFGKLCVKRDGEAVFVDNPKFS